MVQKQPFVELEREGPDLQCPECQGEEYWVRSIPGNMVWHIVCITCNKTLVIDLGSSFYPLQEREEDETGKDDPK